MDAGLGATAGRLARGGPDGFAGAGLGDVELAEVGFDTGGLGAAAFGAGGFGDAAGACIFGNGASSAAAEPGICRMLPHLPHLARDG